MPLKNKSYLEPINKSHKKKVSPPCFTNRLNELNTLSTTPQYIPNTRTPTLRPIPQINSRYRARLSDTQEFEKEILESEENKEYEKELETERNTLKLKFDKDVINERSSIPFGIMPKSKLLSPVMKRGDSGILNSFLSENSLCQDGNLNIVEKTINFGITPNVFEYLRQHSKSVTKAECYHYLSEPPSLFNLNNNFHHKYTIPLMNSLSAHQFDDVHPNRQILKPIKSTFNISKTGSVDDHNKENNNKFHNDNKENSQNNKPQNESNQVEKDHNSLNTSSNDIQSGKSKSLTSVLSEKLNDTEKNKEIIESYANYINKASKELTDMHRLSHYNGINDSEAYKKTEYAISNSTYKFICNIIQNKGEEIKNNNPLKSHKKKTIKSSSINSNVPDQDSDASYWINSIMNGFKDEQLIQDLTHTERLDTKTPIYRQRFPANIEQMHIDVRKKTIEEKRLKYEKLIKDDSNNITTMKSSSISHNDLSNIINIKNIPHNTNNSYNNSNEIVQRNKLFRTKNSYTTISLIRFSSLLKGDPSRQITTYSFEKNDFIQEEDIIPLNLFLKTSLSNYQGPIPKPKTQMFYQMYSVFIQGLKSQDKEVRFMSMHGIAKLDCIEMIPASEKIWFNSLLNQIITEGNNDDKWVICTMLCRHGLQNQSTIEYLKSVLGDTDSAKRKYVIYLLSNISEKCINSLVKDIIYNIIKDANWRVRLDCIRILQRLLKRILKYIPEHDLYIDIDKESVKSENKEFSNIEELNKIINKEKNNKSNNSNLSDIEEKDSYLINKALQIVMNIMWYDWKVEVRNAASSLLMKIGKGKPIYSWIIQMISSDNTMKKINGLKCIGCLNVMTKDAIDPFLKCFDDVFSSVRIEACKVAYILELNYPPLVQKLANCFDDNCWEVRAFAVKAMSRCRCQSNLINDTIIWNLVHETNHRVLFETIKTVKKLNLVNKDNKIREALLLLSEDKNENIAEAAKQILYDNGILFKKSKNIDFISPEDIKKDNVQKEINILYNTRPPYNFACDGLDMIKHEVNLLTMKDFITSEIIEQEKKCKNYNRNESMRKISKNEFKQNSYQLPNMNQHPRRNSNGGNVHYKIRIIDDMTFKYIDREDEE